MKSTATRPRAARRPWLSVALGTVGALLALEVVLQIGHLAVCLSHGGDSDRDVATTDRVVLCIGDSFTYGMGASEPQNSYPAQLERILRAELGPRWRVVNNGWPGQNSREALARIEAQLRACRPEFVCVMIGANDRWSRPPELLLDEGGAVAEAGCRLVWRTGRLALWVANAFLDPRPPGGDPAGDASRVSRTDPAAVVGQWQHLGQRAEFASDGTARYGALDAWWSVEQNVLRVIAEDVPDAVFTWRRVGDRLVLKPLASAEEVVFQRLEDHVENLIAAARRATAEGKTDLARSLVEQLLHGLQPGDDWEPRLRLAMHRVRHASGDVAQARAELDWLRKAWTARPDALSAGCLIEALVTAGSLDEARDVAEHAVAEHVDSDRVWRAVALLRHAEGRAADARRAIDRAIATTSGHAMWRGAVHRTRADVCLAADPTAFADSLVRAYVLDRDRVATRERIEAAQRAGGDAAAAVAGAVAAIVDAPSDAVAELRDLLAADAQSRTHAVLNSHVVQMMDRAVAVGATPVIATYPWPGWDFYDVLGEAARARGALWIPVHESFARARRAEPDEELFVADGHCNDAGYRLLADVIADSLIVRSRKR